VDAKEQVKHLSRGTAEVISRELLESKLAKSIQLKKPLTVKAGFDPSAPDIHLGHTVLLNKLRQFQDLGHEVIYIIGDATARIGDPSGASQTRPMLTEKEIKANAKTYQKQAFRILNPKKTRTVYNNKWLGKLTFQDMMTLASRVTVSQILQRDDFQKRLKANTPISMIELFYPLMQAYDSVEVRADIELGGTDQKFNLLLGRELQKVYGQEPQAVMTLPLLVGLDGVKKMSKSLKNHIAIEDTPDDMFGKVMSVSDELMKDYFTLLTDTDGDDIASKIKSGSLHPKQAKEDLASQIVSRFHGKDKGHRAKAEFQKVFTQHENPTEMTELRLPKGEIPLLDILSRSKLVKSGGEARQMVKQKAVSVDDTVCTDLNAMIEVGPEPKILRVGKRRFIKFLAG